SPVWRHCLCFRFPSCHEAAMTHEEFLRLADQGYNRIPLARETLADFDTPLSIYLKLADAPYSYLLESVQGGEKWGRFSIIGLPSRTRLRVDRSEEHTSELQSRENLVCRLLL